MILLITREFVTTLDIILSNVLVQLPCRSSGSTRSEAYLNPTRDLRWRERIEKSVWR
jgi:hypothetical protein